MSKNIEMNYKNESDYEILYPQTIQALVIDLLNSDTKQLLGLEETATADEAFREIYLNQVLSGKALINFTVVGDDGSPCYGVEINCSTFCDAQGNRVTKVETGEDGKVSIFCDSTSANCSISGYTNLSNWSENIPITFGEQYDKEITLTRSNYKSFASSGSFKVSKDIVRVDFSIIGGGGGAGSCVTKYSQGATGGGGGGGYAQVQNNIDYAPNTSYSFTIGSGGAGMRPNREDTGGNGGTSSFMSYSVSGGNGGEPALDPGATEDVSPGIGGAGNGHGGTGVFGHRDLGRAGLAGGNGTVLCYSSFTETALWGGGGGSGCAGMPDSGQVNGGTGGLNYGGDGGGPLEDNYGPNDEDVKGNPGKGFGGGGGSGGCRGNDDRNAQGVGGNGSSGAIAFRMYRQQDLT